jgi:hypothetical protein
MRPYINARVRTESGRSGANAAETAFERDGERNGEPGCE